MTFYLKILNEVRSGDHLKVDGYSGFIYIFKWSDADRAYTYHPKSQDEVNDLVQTTGRLYSCIFAPVQLPTVEAPPAAPAVEVKKVSEANLEHCLLRSIPISDNDSDDTARRLIEAYDRGYALGCATKPAKKARHEAVAG